MEAENPQNTQIDITPEFYQLLKQYTGSVDPLEDPNFDVAAYLNEKFPDFKSLDNINNLIETFEKEKYSVDLRILGEYFCRNNKNKGRLIINNKKYYLKEFIEIKNMKEKRIKIKMLINKNLYDKNYMFNDCESLLELTINDNLEYIKNYENSEAIDYLFEKNEYDNISEEGGEIFYENQENNESNEFDMDYFGVEDNNTFYEDYSNYISEIKRDTKENEEDSSLIDYIKLFESQYNFSNLKYLSPLTHNNSPLFDRNKFFQSFLTKIIIK